jgi:predicted metal-dependent hydrolase
MAKKNVKSTRIIKEKTIIYKPTKTIGVNKPKPLSDREVQLALIENFVNLQKVLSNLSFKFEGLSQNINNLLQLFEISAKSFIKKHEEGIVITDNTSDRDLLRKLDTLLEQNKTIAKGLTLIEEKIKHKVYGEDDKKESHLDFGAMGRPRPLPKI